MIAIFDCETIPDTKLVRECFEIDTDDDYEATKEAFALNHEKKGSDFLALPYHKVVSISAVICDNFGRFVKVGCFGVDEIPNEEKILGEFLSFIDKKKPRLVSFNGRGFDLPMLFIRAMRYNIACPAYFDATNKWENYRTRFAEAFHLDLMDTLGGFGAVRGLNLNELCKMAGIPGKYDVSGDDVFELYYAKEYKKIDEYCESDVLNTYLLFLKYELLKGNLSLKEYKELILDFKDKIPQDKGYTEVFRAFADKEV